MDRQEKLDYLSELIFNCHKNLTLRHLDRNAGLLGPADKVSLMFYHPFLAGRCPEHLLDYIREQGSRHTHPCDCHFPPVMVSDMFELVWLCVFSHREGTVEDIYLLGPTHISERSKLLLSECLVSSGFSSSLKAGALEMFDQIAVVPVNALFHYASMLHYTLNGEQLPAYIPHAIASPRFQQLQERHASLYASSYINWQTEEQLMKNIEEGNLHYQESYYTAIRTGSAGRQKGLSSLRQYKNILISFTTICCRAAIKGGLSPSIAYSMKDVYIAKAENAMNRSQLSEITHTMYDDFIQQVYQLKNHKAYSAPIQNCCDYISLHIREKLTISELSSLTGYTDYYLSRKFKAETGLSLLDYIKQKKVEVAEKLLASTNLTVQEISEQLSFCSRCHFSETFQKFTGTTPTQYREENMRL